jgi:hypothetical protein
VKRNGSLATAMLVAFGTPWFVRRLTTVTTQNGELDPSGVDDQPERVEVPIEDALLFSAKRRYGTDRYALLLDIDIPVHVVKSSSGNTHLFFDVDLSKAEHDDILHALGAAGVIQDGYMRSGVRSKLGSTLRLPWVKKGDDLTLGEIAGGPKPEPLIKPEA